MTTTVLNFTFGSMITLEMSLAVSFFSWGFSDHRTINLSETRQEKKSNEIVIIFPCKTEDSHRLENNHGPPECGDRYETAHCRIPRRIPPQTAALALSIPDPCPTRKTKIKPTHATTQKSNGIRETKKTEKYSFQFGPVQLRSEPSTTHRLPLNHFPTAPSSIRTVQENSNDNISEIVQRISRKKLSFSEGKNNFEETRNNCYLAWQ